MSADLRLDLTFIRCDKLVLQLRFLKYWNGVGLMEQQPKRRRSRPQLSRMQAEKD